MASLFDALVLSPYKDGVTWWLDQEIIYPSTYLQVKVPSGFETDFASVPWLFTNFLPRWGDYGPASIIHDWLYWSQTGTRHEADNTFLFAMLDTGVHGWKCFVLYAAVRCFGWLAWHDNARLAKEGYSRIHGEGSPVRKPWMRQRIVSYIRQYLKQ